MRPIFASDQGANFEKIKDSVEALCDKLPADGLVDLQPLFFDLTLETALFLLFGDKVPSLGSVKTQIRKPVFADAFTSAQKYLSYRSRLGSLYWLVDTYIFRKACATTRKCVEDMVQNALDRASSPDQQKSHTAFIDTFLEQTKDKAILRDQCINILLASRDTTACSLTWTV